MKKVLVTRFEKDEDDNDRLEENDADDEEEDVEEEGEMWHDDKQGIFDVSSSFICFSHIGRYIYIYIYIYIYMKVSRQKYLFPNN